MSNIRYTCNICTCYPSISTEILFCFSILQKLNTKNECVEKLLRQHFISRCVVFGLLTVHRPAELKSWYNSNQFSFDCTIIDMFECDWNKNVPFTRWDSSFSTKHWNASNSYQLKSFGFSTYSTHFGEKIKSEHIPFVFEMDNEIIRNRIFRQWKQKLSKFA